MTGKHGLCWSSRLCVSASEGEEENRIRRGGAGEVEQQGRRGGRQEGSPSGVRDSRGCGRLEGANRIVINVKWRREQGTENGGAS